MATIELKLRPWQTPNFATVEQPPQPKQAGVSALPTVAVEDLSQQALSALAEEWLTELYAKARKVKDWEFVRVAQ